MITILSKSGFDYHAVSWESIEKVRIKMGSIPPNIVNPNYDVETIR